MLIVTGSMQKVNAELSKVKLHAKSKIASLTAQSKKAAVDTGELVYCISPHIISYCVYLIRQSCTAITIQQSQMLDIKLCMYHCNVILSFFVRPHTVVHCGM